MGHFAAIPLILSIFVRFLFFNHGVRQENTPLIDVLTR